MTTDRLTAEKQELDDRLEKLGVFLAKPEYAACLPIERELLARQYRIMQDYADILGQRLEATCGS